MYIAIFGTDKAGMAEVRAQHFDAFHDYLHDQSQHPDVVLHHAGPTLSEDGAQRIGSLLVVEAPSVEAVQAFISDSPFGRAGLFEELHVRPFHWMTGKPD